MSRVKLSWEQVHAWRMRSQGLAERVPRRLRLEAVSSICGLHAQVMSSAELTLWARVEGLRTGDLADALWKERKLVKTWAMRGTLHLLPASELRLWLGGLATFDDWRKPSWFKAFGITPQELEELIEAVGAALDGELLTRADLAQEVARAGGDSGLAEKLTESWSPYLKPAAFRGLLCFGPDSGRNVRFTSPRSWIGAVEALPPDEALPGIARRWLRALGPASREDLSRWWGYMTAAQAGRLINSLGDEVVEVDVEGSAQWLLSSQAAEIARCEPARAVRLVPAFDQFVVGVPRKGPGAPFEAKQRTRIYRQAGWLSPALVVDGKIEGVWRHERKGKRLLVEVERFGKPAKWVRAGAEHEAARLGEFLGGELSVIWA